MAESTFTSALDTALKGVADRDTLDGATVRLAREYAAQLDDGGDLTKLGPQLLAVLTALGMTPAARNQVAKGGAAGGQPEQPTSPLDELRKRRAARQRDTAAVDTAPTGTHT